MKHREDEAESLIAAVLEASALRTEHIDGSGESFLARMTSASSKVTATSTDIATTNSTTATTSTAKSNITDNGTIVPTTTTNKKDTVSQWSTKGVAVESSYKEDFEQYEGQEQEQEGHQEDTTATDTAPAASETAAHTVADTAASAAETGSLETEPSQEGADCGGNQSSTLDDFITEKHSDVATVGAGDGIDTQAAVGDVQIRADSEVCTAVILEETATSVDEKKQEEHVQDREGYEAGETTSAEENQDEQLIQEEDGEGYGEDDFEEDVVDGEQEGETVEASTGVTITAISSAAIEDRSDVEVSSGATAAVSSAATEDRADVKLSSTGFNAATAVSSIEEGAIPANSVDVDAQDTTLVVESAGEAVLDPSPITPSAHAATVGEAVDESNPTQPAEPQVLNWDLPVATTTTTTTTEPASEQTVEKSNCSNDLVHSVVKANEDNIVPAAEEQEEEYADEFEDVHESTIDPQSTALEAPAADVNPESTALEASAVDENPESTALEAPSLMITEEKLLEEALEAPITAEEASVITPGDYQPASIVVVEADVDAVVDPEPTAEEAPAAVSVTVELEPTADEAPAAVSTVEPGPTAAALEEQEEEQEYEDEFEELQESTAEPAPTAEEVPVAAVSATVEPEPTAEKPPAVVSAIVEPEPTAEEAPAAVSATVEPEPTAEEAHAAVSATVEHELTTEEAPVAVSAKVEPGPTAEEVPVDAVSATVEHKLTAEEAPAAVSATVEPEPTSDESRDVHTALLTADISTRSSPTKKSLIGDGSNSDFDVDFSEFGDSLDVSNLDRDNSLAALALAGGEEQENEVNVAKEEVVEGEPIPAVVVDIHDHGSSSTDNNTTAAATIPPTTVTITPLPQSTTEVAVEEEDVYDVDF